MKKSSDNLFELVLSMSKGEKLFFRNYLKNNVSGKSNQYVKLFDLISGTRQPEEEKIRKKLNIKNYSKIKWYLYESIMECLRLYYKESSDDVINIYNLVLNAVILKNKALTRQSMAMLAKAEKLAAQNENFSILQEISLLNLSIIREPVIQMKAFREITSNRMKEAFEAIEKNKNVFQYLNLGNQLLYFMRVRGEFIRDEKELNKISHLVNDPLLKDEKKAITDRSKRLFYNINAVLSAISGNFEMAYTYSARQAKYLDQKQEKERRIIAIFHNSAHYALCTKKWTEAKYWIGRINSIKSPFKDIHYLQFQYVLTSELFLHNKRGDFEKAISLAEEKEAELKKNIHKLDPIFLTEIITNISGSYFLAENYRKSLEWINRIFSDKKSKPRDEIAILSRMFKLLLYYEMGDYESLNYAQDALYRYLTYKNRMFDFEKEMILFFRKLLKARSEKVKEILFRKLQVRLNELNKNPLSTPVVSIYFDYPAWVESKIRRIRFSEVLKEKATGN